MDIKVQPLKNLTDADRSVFADPYFSLNMFEKSLKTPSCVAFAARAGEDLLGYILAQRGGETVDVLTVFVAPQVRRQGIARQLLNALLSQMKIAGVREVVLEVRISNLPARQLYETAGFVFVATRENYYAPTEASPREDAAVYRLVL